MRKINVALAKLKKREPVYYVATDEFTYKNGLKLSKTNADIIRLNLEHGPFDMWAVRKFIDGIIDGGPTKFGDRTPFIIAELPFDGNSKTSVISNSWIIKQLLAQGVHGLLLCHASSSKAVKEFVKNSFYSFEKIKGLGQGQRGHGGQERAAHVWGISTKKYLEMATLWPQNPNGHIVLGVKLENKKSFLNANRILKIKGLCFAEWGPGDMTMSMGYKNAYYPPYPKEIVNIQNKLRNLIIKNNLFFLNLATVKDIKKIINMGTMIIKPHTLNVINIGRRIFRKNEK